MREKSLQKNAISIDKRSLVVCKLQESRMSFSSQPRREADSTTPEDRIILDAQTKPSHTHRCVARPTKSVTPTINKYVLLAYSCKTTHVGSERASSRLSKKKSTPSRHVDVNQHPPRRVGTSRSGFRSTVNLATSPNSR